MVELLFFIFEFELQIWNPRVQKTVKAYFYTIFSIWTNHIVSDVCNFDSRKTCLIENFYNITFCTNINIFSEIFSPTAVNFEFFISDSKSRIQNTNRCKVVKNLHGEDFWGRFSTKI